jgi:hypothetical protein
MSQRQLKGISYILAVCLPGFDLQFADDPEEPALV